MLGFLPNASGPIGEDELNDTGDGIKPVMGGGITITLVTHDTIALSWDSASDNIAVTNYQYSFDGGATWFNNGTTRNTVRSGLQAFSDYNFAVRAADASGNVSDPLRLVISTLQAPPPVLPQAVAPVTAASRSRDWLKLAIARWSHRDNLDPMMDDFIMLAEKRINGDLEARLQVAATSIRTTAKLDGVLLPTDVAEISALSLPSYGALEYVAPDKFNQLMVRGETGVPKYYTVFGPYLHLSPTPNAAYDIACAYRQKIPSLLDEDDGVNWLIREQPDIYLAACMCEVINYTKNFAEMTTWDNKYRNAVESLNRVDWYTGTALRIRTDTRTV